MVGIVIVSHSKMVADGIVSLGREMAKNTNMISAGGTEDGKIGTCAKKIATAIKNVYSEDGVLVLFDIGSSLINAKEAINLLDEKTKSKVKIVDCALVEGAMISAIQSNIGSSMKAILEQLETVKLGKIN